MTPHLPNWFGRVVCWNRNGSIFRKGFSYRPATVQSVAKRSSGHTKLLGPCCYTLLFAVMLNHAVIGLGAIGFGDDATTRACVPSTCCAQIDDERVTAVALANNPTLVRASCRIFNWLDLSNKRETMKTSTGWDDIFHSDGNIVLVNVIVK